MMTSYRSIKSLFENSSPYLKPRKRMSNLVLRDVKSKLFWVKLVFGAGIVLGFRSDSVAEDPSTIQPSYKVRSEAGMQLFSTIDPPHKVFRVL